MATSHAWKPISGIPGDPADLTDGELIPLARVWKTQKEQLIQMGALDEFDKRLRREWAIETGIIEDVYTLDRGVTNTLIEKGIDAALIGHGATNRDPTLVARIIQDQYDALDGMFDFVAGRRTLSTGYIKELHAALLRNIDSHVVQDRLGRVFEKSLEKGACKTEPNSPTRPDGAVHEYSPPEHVASEMDELIRLHRENEEKGAPPEVAAAWLHHRFTEIHPFADGNGRVARALASLVFIRSGWFPLVVKRDDRVRYIEALEKADSGDLRPLISLFVEIQRNLLISATEIGYDVRPIASAHDAVLAARDRLVQRGKLPRKEWLAANAIAAELVKDATSRLEATAADLQTEIATLGKGFGFVAGSGSQAGYDSVRKRALDDAGQVVDSGGYNAAASLTLQTGKNDALIISFQAIGPRFRGFVSVIAYLNLEGMGGRRIERGAFQINYEEDLGSAKKRFSTWLDPVIVEGLNQWRLTL